MAGFLDTILGRTNLGSSDFNYDPSGRANKRYEQLSDPRFLLQNNLKIASNAAPSKATLLQLAQAGGGSQGAANAQAQALANQAQEQALNSYEQSQQNFQGLANQALNMDLEKEKYIKENLAQQEYANAANTSSFINSAFTGGIGLLTGGSTSWLDFLNGGQNNGAINESMKRTEMDSQMLQKIRNQQKFPIPRGY